MTRPVIILTPMISQAPLPKRDFHWLAPVVCFVAVAAPLVSKTVLHWFHF